MRDVFQVQDVPVYGDVILSPMAGYSDVPYRAICRAYGSAMQYTEFVPVEALLGRRVHERFRRRLDKKPDEYPMVFQIFGNDAQKLLEAALRIEPWGADIIDINMGCSTRKVSGRGAGAGMMRQPDLVAQTFSLLSRRLTVPVTGKIRLGWDAARQNYLEIGRIMEENGAALIAMHGRTKTQKYGGQADWEAIARLKQSVSIPVIGNGDAQTPQDIDRMLAWTGCDAVMVGRGAIGNPWIFARQQREELTLAEILMTVRRHSAEMIAYYGLPAGLIQFRKHLKAYLAGILDPDDYLPLLLTITNPAEFEVLLRRMETAVPANVPISQLTAVPETYLTVGEW